MYFIGCLGNQVLVREDSYKVLLLLLLVCETCCMCQCLLALLTMCVSSKNCLSVHVSSVAKQSFPRVDTTFPPNPCVVCCRTTTSNVTVVLYNCGLGPDECQSRRGLWACLRNLFWQRASLPSITLVHMFRPLQSKIFHRGWYNLLTETCVLYVIIIPETCMVLHVFPYQN